MFLRVSIGLYHDQDQDSPVKPEMAVGDQMPRDGEGVGGAGEEFSKVPGLPFCGCNMKSPTS